MGTLAKLPRAEQWADQICTQLSKSAEAIIATGRLLVKAKADLEYGEWGRMFKDKLVPFGERSAHMLMTVANHRLISDRNHGSVLPPSWRTLYELTTVPDKALDNAFRDGLITPSMERREVKALMPLSARETAQSRPEQVDELVEPEQADDEVDEPEPVAPDYTGHQTARRVPSAPSNGMQFARIAVMKLEEIRDDDSERQQAFDHVRSWLDARET